MRFVAAYIVLLCTACAASVAAQQPDETAQALFDNGRAAIRDGDYERACQFFRDSDQLESAPGTKLNLADCEERRGKLATAWQLFSTLAASLPAGDDRIAIARDRAGALEPRLPKVTLDLSRGAPPATAIRLDGVPLPPASLGVPLALDPGEHEFVTSAPGHLARTTRIQVEQQESRRLELVPRPRSKPVDRNETSSGFEMRTLGFIVGGAGAASLGLAAITGAMVLGKKSTVEDHCNAQRRCDSTGVSAARDGRTLQTVTNVELVFAVLGLGVDTYSILTSKDDERVQTRLAVGPTAGGATASLLGCW